MEKKEIEAIFFSREFKRFLIKAGDQVPMRKLMKKIVPLYVAVLFPIMQLFDMHLHKSSFLSTLLLILFYEFSALFLYFFPHLFLSVLIYLRKKNILPPNSHAKFMNGMSAKEILEGRWKSKMRAVELQDGIVFFNFFRLKAYIYRPFFSESTYEALRLIFLTQDLHSKNRANSSEIS